MHPTKTPGLDGLRAIFYHKFWNKLGSSLYRFVIDFLDGRFTSEEVNMTNIVLIPTVDQPEKVSQFRSICLCNVCYKVASKALTNILKGIIYSTVSVNQSAFITRRLISDNVTVAQEIIHFLHNKRQGKVGNFALKLDMSKAYDKVEWSFIREIMEKLGFKGKFIDW